MAVYRALLDWKTDPNYRSKARFIRVVVKTACTPAGYLGGQEEIKSHCELCKF